MDFNSEFLDLITSFNNKGEFKKEEFRLFILNKFLSIYQKLNFYIKGDKNKIFWQRVNDWAFSQKKIEVFKLGFERINNLDKHLNNWIRDSVKSKESFEFFILSKASEINSGDMIADYYLAQMIRHDQLWAVVLVYDEALKKIKKCTEMDKDKVLDSGEFGFFIEKEMEKRIYETAVWIYELRVGDNI